MQHVGGAQQESDRLADFQVQHRVVHHHIVLAEGVRWIDTQRIVCSGVAYVHSAQLAIIPGQSVGPVPLPGQDLNFHGVIGGCYHVRPDEKSRCQHGRHANGSKACKPILHFDAFRFVFGPAALLVPEFDHAIGDKHIHQYETNPGHNKGQCHRIVHRGPIGRNRCEIPGTNKMKQNRPENQDEQNDRNYHKQPSCTPCTLKYTSAPQSAAACVPDRVTTSVQT